MKITNIQSNTNFGITTVKPKRGLRGETISKAAREHFQAHYKGKSANAVDSNTVPGVYYCQFPQGYERQEIEWRAYLDSQGIFYDPLDVKVSKATPEQFAQWCAWRDKHINEEWASTK